MSITINFYSMSQPVNAMNKFPNGVPSASKTFSGSFKEADSGNLSNPILIVKSAISGLTGVNYAHIESFGRWYYIRDMKAVTSETTEIVLDVDPLYSFRTAILSQPALVARQENDYRQYLDDAAYVVTNRQIVDAYTLGSGQEASGFILAVAGG